MTPRIVARVKARNATIAEIWQVVQDEQLYIPIHHQVLNWGMAEKVNTHNLTRSTR